MTKEKTKKKGPIRTGAVIPLAVFIAVVVGFNILLLDSTIKKAIEWGGSYANGAEVNVANVSSSFRDLSIEVSGIQFTDKKNPKFNLFEIGTLRFHMLWDALLRAKVVIDLAELADIKIQTEREKVGFVPPPPKNTATGKVLDVAKKEFDGNVFGDIASVAAGASAQDTGEAIKQGLTSEKKFSALESKIEEQQENLEKSFNNLPTDKELKSLENRLRNINWKDLTNLAKAGAVLKTADKLRKDINSAFKKYQKAQSEVKKSDDLLNSAYREANASVEGDIQAVGSRMKIPSLNPTSIAIGLFGSEIFAKVDELRAQYKKIEKYLPPKKSEKTSEKQVDIKEQIAAKRGVGKDYQFGTPNSYPLFWLKLAKINSSNQQGTVSGQIENVTNNQRQIGKLTTAEVKADFPAKNVRGMNALVTIDHRDQPKAQIEGRIRSFDVQNKAISQTEAVTFKLKKAAVESILKGELTPKRAAIRIQNNFTKIDYHTEAQSPVIDEVLADVAKNTKVLRLDAKVSGKWEALGFDIQSNLARAIQASVQGLVQAKIRAMKEKIRRDVEAKIAKQKAKIQQQISRMKGQYETQLAQAKKQINKIKSQLGGAEKKAKKQAKKNSTDKLKKNLLKGLNL